MPITNKEDCLKVGGQWTDPTPLTTPTPEPYPTQVKYIGYPGSCDPNYTKQIQFNEAQKAYSRNVFIVLVVLGVISIVIGALLANAILSLAFAWGGVLSLIIASVRYWSDANNIVKVLVLAAALAALIWVAVKKFGK